MEFQDVVDRRRMVRSFSDRPVDPAVIDRALRNATRAPSAGFTQGWGFLLLDRPADVRRWWETTVSAPALAAPDRWLTGMLTAPVLVVPCSSQQAYLRRYAEADKAASARIPAPGRSPWSMPYWHLDTAMAALLLLQTAVDAGLGGCFFAVPRDREDAVRDAFTIDPAFTPIGVVAIGHPEGTGGAGSAAGRTRRPMTEVVHRGRWRGPGGTGAEESPEGGP